MNNLSRRGFIKTTGIASLGSLGLIHAAKPLKRPNVIIIFTDDQPPTTIKSWGGKVLTPNIDSLVNDGMKFTRAFTTSSVCAPSRYALLTGRYPSRCMHQDFLKPHPLGTISRPDNVRISLEKDRMNVASVLKKNGYKTGIVGKWHLSEMLKKPLGPTWEEFGLKTYKKNADPKDPEVDAALKYNQKLMQDYIKEHGFDYAASIYWANLKEVRNSHLNFHNIDWTVKGALDFIDQNKSNPFFLYFSTTLLHGPAPKHSIRGKELVTGEGLLKKPLDVMPSRDSIFKRVKEEGLKEKTAECTWLDDGVGAILKKLDKLKISDNTIVIYLSDHHITHKTSLYDKGVYIPMMIRWKDHIKPNSICDELVNSVDIVPTIFNVVGINQPKDDIIDGISLKPLMLNKKVKWREHIFMEIGWARAVRSKDWKYIAVRYPKEVEKKFKTAKENKLWRLKGYIENHGLVKRAMRNKNYADPDQLYNLKDDPDEQNNLAKDKKYAGQLKKMKAVMKKYLKTFPDRPYGEFTKG